MFRFSGSSEKTATLKVMSMNTFLIPAMIVNADNATCTEQDVRAGATAAMIRKLDPDVVALQEMWGSCHFIVERGVQERYDVPRTYSSWGSSVLDSISQFVRGLGGLWVATRRGRVEVLGMWRESYSFSNTRSRKGMVGMLLRHTETGKHAVLVNTHLDPSNLNQAQEKQLAQLGCFIDDMAGKVETAVRSETAFIVCGDFNITHGTSLHRTMLRTLGKEVDDPWKGSPDTTYGTSLASWGPSCIDHIVAVRVTPKGACFAPANTSQMERIDYHSHNVPVASDHFPILTTVAW
eukprot:Sspe_Gene.87790::Locus_59616_Transcript_1_1_Confidence_1.000_Length_991::g.87790::m.87790